MEKNSLKCRNFLIFGKYIKQNSRLSLAHFLPNVLSFFLISVKYSQKSQEFKESCRYNFLVFSNSMNPQILIFKSL